MTKTKLRRFAENETFPHLIQQERGRYPLNDHALKGNWNRDFFKREAPIVLELACGRGEYTVSLCRFFPEKNFIGIDWKGARLWRGAKTVHEEKISNAAFLRIQIQNVLHYFGKQEVDEIWITFPDPQPREGHSHKRLTSLRFLDLYKQFLKPGGIINLKTDSKLLYDFTMDTIRKQSMRILSMSEDIYNSDILDEVLSIQTTYEKKWLKDGFNIYYIRYQI